MKHLALLACLWLVSCSTYVRDNCSTESSAKEARERAKKWLSSEADTKAPNCEGNRHFGPSNFKAVYEQAYSDQLKVQCTKDYVSGQASLNNTDLKFDTTLLEKLKKCDEIKVDSKSLQKHYRANVAKLYCSKKRTTDFALKHAKNFKAPNTDHLSFCYRKTKSSLSKHYNISYNKEISRVCSPVEITAMAIKDVKLGKELVDGVQLLSKCPAKIREKALATYKESYYAEADRKDKK